MIEVRALENLNPADLRWVASGYSSNGKYEVVLTDSGNHLSIELRFVALNQPYVKKYDHFDDETTQRYNRVLKDGYSFGAFDGDLLVGLVIAEARSWNRSLWVYEFHVAETHRNLGIGKRLMECAAEKAKDAELRIIVCETQNTNAAAIEVYRKFGFKIEGVDISYYSNADYPDGEIAVFMKRRLK
jgi:ribosomal protein S18 acetylase RimI-like enzyme